MTVTSRNPNRASWRSTTSMIGIGSSTPSGISGLGRTYVYGRSRVPLPPASSTACIVESSLIPAVDRATPPSLAPPARRAVPGPRRHSTSPNAASVPSSPAPPPRRRRPAARRGRRTSARRPSRRASPDIARRARSSAIWSRAAISSASAPGGGQDEALLAVGHQLAGAVLLGGDHGQAARQGLEHDQRARVVVRRLDEEVARPVGVADVGVKARGSGHGRRGPAAPPCGHRAPGCRCRRPAGGSAGPTDGGARRRRGPRSAGAGP